MKTTDQDNQVLAILISAFNSMQLGKQHAITNLGIRRKLEDNFGIIVSDIAMRGYIHTIRSNGSVPMLIAGSMGYYRTDDDVELQKYIDSLHLRAASITAVARAMESQLSPKLQQSITALNIFAAPPVTIKR